MSNILTNFNHNVQNAIGVLDSTISNLSLGEIIDVIEYAGGVVNYQFHNQISVSDDIISIGVTVSYNDGRNQIERQLPELLTIGQALKLIHVIVADEANPVDEANLNLALRTSRVLVDALLAGDIHTTDLIPVAVFENANVEEPYMTDGLFDANWLLTNLN